MVENYIDLYQKNNIIGILKPKTNNYKDQNNIYTLKKIHFYSYLKFLSINTSSILVLLK